MKAYCCQGMKVFLPLVVVVSVLGLSGLFAGEEASSWSYKKLDNNRIIVFDNGDFFAQYIPNFQETPIIWPICSAQGNLMTRNYPMVQFEDLEKIDCPVFRNIIRNAKVGLGGEAQDHPHQRSFWFTHGDVNKHDFWSLNTPNKLYGFNFKKKGGSTAIVPVGDAVIEAGKDGVVIKTKNNWLDTDKKEILASDEQTWSFGSVSIDGKVIRYIDLDIVLTARAQQEDGTPFTFGDTKEGTLGIRIAGTMDLSRGQQKKAAKPEERGWKGLIRNSEGLQNQDAWGKRASWVDYSGTVPKRLSDEQLVPFEKDPASASFPLVQGGITIMNHPKSFRYPTWWHVRDYGLFAANPFGQKDFEEGKADGSVPLKIGESLSFRHRVLFHDGELDMNTLARLFDDYAKK